MNHGAPLASPDLVGNQYVIRTATELLSLRRFASAAALCEDALADDPDDPDLRLLLARALLPLGRDDDANRHLREVVRLSPACANGYRYLGEVSLRRNLIKSAQMFFRRAHELCPGDPEIGALVELANSLSQPAATVDNFPAATAAVGCDSSPSADPLPRFARGTTDRPRPPLGHLAPSDLTPRLVFRRRPHLAPPRSSAPRADAPQPATVGFETFLLESGALSATQLRAARVYRRSRGIHLGSAMVALGFMTRQRLEQLSQSYRRRTKR
ncbi:MAG TPA: tetratricopeptide repeat protein [Kofleriaceae bacterium]|nr:tetratricopeptide repeat protein [Kofleriaceae bacterium]